MYFRLTRRAIPLIIFSLVIISGNVSAQDIADPATQPEYEVGYQGLPICPPAVYLVPPADCLPYGPSTVLTEWARKGMFLPLRPLPVFKPDESYLAVDRNYAKLNIQPGTQAAYYPNVESAVQSWGALRTLPPGETLYITYKNVSYYNNNPYLQNERGEWIRASPTTYSQYQGLLFKRTPVNRFGWIIDPTNPMREPSIFAQVVNEPLARENVVQVYDQIEAEGTTWYMIGFGKWVDRNKIRVVSPNPTPPQGVENGRWVDVDLYQQTLAVYEENELVFATLISTGYDPYYTQPGLFQVREKIEFETMTGAFQTGKVDYYLLEDVPWTMYYDGPRALHGAYWRSKFGSELSHGCINLSVGDSHWLFEWADVGDWVYVHDPSGLTPTDPAFYEGNAAF